MGFINLDLGNVKESKSVPAGRYRLVIANWEETESREKKTPQLKFTLNIEGHDDAMPVNHYIPLPNKGDEAKSAAFKALLLKRFLVLFNIPHEDTGFNPDDTIGASADAELQVGEPNSSGDTFNNLVVPKLKTEGEAAPRSPGKKVAAAGSKR